ncbi:MAG: radical SAM protein [Thermodesulfobacteriota bacterium]
MNYILRDIRGKKFIVNLTTNKYYELKNYTAKIFWEKYQENYFDGQLALQNIKRLFPSVKEVELKNNFEQFLSSFQDNEIDHNINIFRLENNKDIPERVYFELTEDCPFKCVHCFCPRDRHIPQLSTDKIKSILDELHELGTIYITMTGGDPLTRRDFPELYLYAKKKGFLIYLFTNLYLLNKQHVELFLQYPPFLIDVTLYGSCNEVYYDYTRIENAFDKVMANLKTLKNNNINFRLKTPLSIINYHDIDNIEAIAGQLSKYFTISTYIFPKLNGKKHLKELKCSIDTVINFEKRNKNRIEKLKYKYLKGKELLEKHHGLRCEQGINAFAINGLY